MISEIRLINYRKFVCERIPLEPITGFIGPNGSGKSTVASAIHTIAAIMRLGLQSAFPEGFFSFDRILSYDAEKFGYDETPMGLGISGKFDDLSFDYDIIFSKDSSDFFIHYEGIKIKESLATYHYSTGDNINIELPTSGGEILADKMLIGGVSFRRDTIFLESELEKIANFYNISFLVPLLDKVKKHIQRITTYQFSASTPKMGCAQYAGSNVQPVLRAEGENLPEVLQYFQEERRDLLLKVKEWIEKYTQNDSRVVGIGVSNYDNKVFLNFFQHGKDGKIYPIRGPLLSDGYWIFAAFACLASCENIPSVAFFEEPEAHLHPHKLPILYDVFKSISQRKEKPCQALISTHSPYFLDLFKENPESVILLNNGKAKRLTEIRDYEKILSLYSIGESWYSNIFEWGNP